MVPGEDSLIIGNYLTIIFMNTIVDPKYPYQYPQRSIHAEVRVLIYSIKNTRLMRRVQLFL